MNKPWFTKFSDVLLGNDKHIKDRLQNWLVCLIIYVLFLTGLGAGSLYGLVLDNHFSWLATTILLSLSIIYILIRSGWSEQLQEPSLTTAQIVLCTVSVFWAYYASGIIRGAFLLPLPLMLLIFASFSSSARNLGLLIVSSIFGLVVTTAWIHYQMPKADWSLDIANLLALCFILPACLWADKRIAGLKTLLREKSLALTQLTSEVQRLGTRDELTGLPNRRHMQEVMNLEYQRCVRSGHVFCIAVIDLDHFKNINTQHGRTVGDEVLRHFAQEALQVIRISDVLARWGGEEFLLIMSDTRAPLARLGLERLRERIESLHIKVQNLSIQVTMSAGVVEHLPGENVANAIARADTALYLAKAQGRNRIVVG